MTTLISKLPPDLVNLLYSAGNHWVLTIKKVFFFLPSKRTMQSLKLVFLSALLRYPKFSTLLGGESCHGLLRLFPFALTYSTLLRGESFKRLQGLPWWRSG